MEFSLKELEVSKLNLQPGEILAVTIKNSDITYESLNNLNEGLTKYFPNNKIVLFAMSENDEVKFSVLGKEPVSYCSDCNCGKKEQSESGKDT